MGLGQTRLPRISRMWSIAASQASAGLSSVRKHCHQNKNEYVANEKLTPFQASLKHGLTRA
eukprot:5289471-Amphidinium_carterae.1